MEVKPDFLCKDALIKLIDARLRVGVAVFVFRSSQTPSHAS